MFLLLHSNEKQLNIVLQTTYYSGTVCMSCSIPSFPERWGLGRDLAPGRCEVDLRFFNFSAKIKDRLVCCCLFFSPSIYSGFTHSALPEPKLSTSVNKCERLEIVSWVLGWQIWTSWGGCRFENSVYCMCLTHSEIGFQQSGGRGVQRAIMPVRMCWLFNVLCLPSAEHACRENNGVGIF